jgi:hypothetical protein
MLDEALVWINVLMGFAWLMKLMSLALNDRLKAVLVCSAIGGVGVALIHLILAIVYASIERPALLTFWNAAFLVTSIIFAFAVMTVRSIVHRSATRSPQVQDKQ